MSDTASKKQDQFIVRLPEGLRDRIKAVAEANNRSMNADIVAKLEKAYPAPLPADYYPKLIGIIVNDMAELLAKHQAAVSIEEMREFEVEFGVLRERLKDAQNGRSPWDSSNQEPLGAAPPKYRTQRSSTS